MGRKPFLVFVLLLSSAHFGQASPPAGFSWANLETDEVTMAQVRHALRDTSITAIREVGMEGGFALVMTASREAGAPTPDYDRWTIYNVSLKTGMSKVLVSGYGVKLLDWLGADNDELAISYFDCWECEAATLFTTLRLKNGVGFRARWPNKTEHNGYPQPGAVAKEDEDVNWQDDNEVEFVFAVVSQPGDGFAAGSWEHVRNNKTGKIDDNVERYSIDPTTKEDRVEKLEGRAALNWQRQICTPSRIVVQPSTGQDSKVCKSALPVTSPQRPVTK